MGDSAIPEAPVPHTWDIQADVVVVGFGAAGACAALEAAAAGGDVVVLDRFTGGGATALSGGVVYAGGGTSHQLAAGVRDSPEAMFSYLSLEVGDAVSPATLREFCRGSRDMLAWLERHGVQFEGSLCPDKISYPTNRHYLYYSGSELSALDVAPPAPRGHRVRGRGTSGGLPLGTPGDDGSGIRLGVMAGGATAFLDRISVWRFLSPPPALLGGVLVDRAGLRVCDESRYGAAIGEAMMARHGQAWLFAD